MSLFHPSEFSEKSLWLLRQVCLKFTFRNPNLKIQTIIVSEFLEILYSVEHHYRIFNTFNYAVFNYARYLLAGRSRLILLKLSLLQVSSSLEPLCMLKLQLGVFDLNSSRNFVLSVKRREPEPRKAWIIIFHLKGAIDSFVLLLFLFVRDPLFLFDVDETLFPHRGLIFQTRRNAPRVRSRPSSDLLIFPCQTSS